MKMNEFKEQTINGKLVSVPSDWKIENIKNLIYENKKSKLKAGFFKRQGENPAFNCSPEQFLFYENYLVKNENLFLSTGGQSAIHYYNGNAAYSTDVYSIKTNSIMKTKFLFFLMKNNIGFISEMFVGAGLKHLNKNLLKKSEWFFPNIEEQEKIINALNATENTIQTLENLIQKKQYIFKGVTEELLTGKKRLPGFKNKWENKTMEDMFNFSGGMSISRDKLGNTGTLYLHYGDIHLSKKTYINTSIDADILPRFNSNKIAKNKLLKHGDIVFLDASEDLEGVSKYWVVENLIDIPFIAGSHNLVARHKTSHLNIEFTKYCFLLEEVRKQFQLYSVGTKVSGVNKTSIKKIKLSFPSDINEQKAIANLLSTIEKELNTLEIKLDKLNNIKKGMEDQLLTGKIRLPLNK